VVRSEEGTATAGGLLRSWVIRFRPHPAATLRMFCFHHAGGGASAYRPWVAELPAGLELCAIQLPGREGRLREKPYQCLANLVPVVAGVIEPLLDGAIQPSSVDLRIDHFFRVFRNDTTPFIDPKQAFSLAKNFEMLLGPVIGGRLSLLGPILGAGFIKPMEDLLRGWLGGGADAFYLILYGAVLAAGCLLLPRGFATYLEVWHRRLVTRAAA